MRAAFHEPASMSAAPTEPGYSDRAPDRTGGAVPPSPCVRVCSIDPATGHCTGCARTLAEIAAWPRLADAERLAIMTELPARRRAGPGAPAA